MCVCVEWGVLNRSMRFGVFSPTRPTLLSDALHRIDGIVCVYGDFLRVRLLRLIPLCARVIPPNGNSTNAGRRFVLHALLYANATETVCEARSHGLMLTN